MADKLVWMRRLVENKPRLATSAGLLGRIFPWLGCEQRCSVVLAAVKRRLTVTTNNAREKSCLQIMWSLVSESFHLILTMHDSKIIRIIYTVTGFRCGYRVELSCSKRNVQNRSNENLVSALKVEENENVWNRNVACTNCFRTKCWQSMIKALTYINRQRISAARVIIACYYRM